MLSREAVNVAEVAARLTLLRRALKMTQADISRFINITPQTWNNAETGDYRLGLNLAIRLCNATGASLDWLYLGRRGGLATELNQAIAVLEKKRS